MAPGGDGAVVGERQAVEVPAAMAVTVLSSSDAGTVVWPWSLVPQAVMVPSSVSARLWDSPAAMAVTVLLSSDAGTVVWPAPFQPQEVMVPPTPEGGTPTGAAVAGVVAPRSRLVRIATAMAQASEVRAVGRALGREPGSAGWGRAACRRVRPG